ncbi:MAG: histidine phosphatase family protein [Caldilineaceae bacterium]
MLYLITHAHTQQQRDVDAATWTLSERGGQQAATLAREQFWANVTRIVLSSEPKTRLTVEPVLAARDLPVTVDARFNELKRPAAWTDDYVAAVAAAFDRPHESVNGWEAAAAAQARFIHGIEDLCQRFPNGTFALVGHGLTFSLYRRPAWPSPRRSQRLAQTQLCRHRPGRSRHRPPDRRLPQRHRRKRTSGVRLGDCCSQPTTRNPQLAGALHGLPGTRIPGNRRCDPHAAPRLSM